MQDAVKSKTLIQTVAIVVGLLTVSGCVLWATWTANRPKASAGGRVDAAGVESAPTGKQLTPNNAKCPICGAEFRVPENCPAEIDDHHYICPGCGRILDGVSARMFGRQIKKASAH